MSHPDTPMDPPPSISAAELRRRLLASTPPPAQSGGSGVVEQPAVTVKVGVKANSIGAQLSRLTMPGTNGPVAATSLAPVADLVETPPVLPTRSRLAAMADVAPSAPAMIPSPSGVMGVSHSRGGPALEPSATASNNGRVHTEDDYRRIKQENRELRKLLDEMKQLLQEASDNEQTHGTREAQLTEQLAQKQRQIEELTDQLQMIEEQVASGALMQAPPTPKTRTELEEWNDELEQEANKIHKSKRDLDEERKQLRDDEESLERQMRQMEVSMAKERALMARQETELKRLSAEIQHELEIMQRGDAALREQLSKFQRRAADVMSGRMGPNAAPPPPTGRR
jgi:hypothetical protein